MRASIILSPVMLLVCSGRAMFAATGAGGDDPMLLNNLGGELFAAGQYRAAEAPLVRALELWSANPPVEFEIALHNLAAVYRAQGRYKEALPLYQRAIHLREIRLGGYDLSLLSPLNGLALLYLEFGHPRDSKETSGRALSIASLHHDVQTTEAANGFGSLGSILSSQGRHAEAKSWLQRAQSIRQCLSGPDSTPVADTLMDLALVCRRERNLDEAAQYYSRALRIYKRCADTAKSASAMRNLAELLLARRKHIEADELLANAQLELKSTSNPDPVESGRLHSDWADLRAAQHRAAEAITFYRQALAELEPALGSDNPQLVSIMEAYARVLRDVQDYATAAAMDLRVMKIRVRQTLDRQG